MQERVRRVRVGKVYNFQSLSRARDTRRRCDTRVAGNSLRRRRRRRRRIR